MFGGGRGGVYNLIPMTTQSQVLSILIFFYFRREVKETRNLCCFHSYSPGIALPDNWVAQPTDATGKEMEVHLVQLDPVKDKDEYKKIADEVAKTAAINITKIERVQNPTLFRTYTVRKQRMDEKNGSNEKRLFHGTAAGSCANINSLGFNRSFCGKNGERRNLHRPIIVKFASVAQLRVLLRNWTF